MEIERGEEESREGGREKRKDDETVHSECEYSRPHAKLRDIHTLL